jgi:ubiquinone/menaquinone biosynthesis C-methylase UbiE
MSSPAIHPSHVAVAGVFDRAAADYDGPALRFFGFCADRLVARLNPAPGDKILDVAAGTGAVTLAAAQAVGPAGRVTAIDLAEGMLERLARKIDKFGVGNVDLHVMDAAGLEFRRDYFHHVVCSFGLFFLNDMAAALAGWVRVLRPGGKLMFTAFGSSAFEPMKRLLLARLEREGVDTGASARTAHSLSDPDTCRALLTGAGLTDVSVETGQLGHHLLKTEDWWEAVWGAGLRGLVEQLPPARRDAVRAAHLAEVAPLMTDKGLWLDVAVHFACGVKP